MGNGVEVILLKAEKPQQCDLCGKIAELRPYGPNGECVCFECAMKDEESAQRQFKMRTDGTHPMYKAVEKEKEGN
jgi:hypothetical protein